MNDKSKRILSSFFMGILGGLVVVLLFFFLISKYNLNDSENSKTIESNNNSVTNVYQNSVGSVISVVNLRDIKVENDFLQKFLEDYYGGNSIEQGVGSGFVYKKESGYYYAVTNNHVIEGSDEIGIITTNSSKKDNSNKLIDAEVIGSDKDKDVAVIRFKTSENIKSLKFANSDNIVPGEEVYAIGSPYGTDFQGSITKGIVSAPIRVFSDNNKKYIQTDAAINPGNSGGPLLNEEGFVIGMDTMKISDGESDNMGFAIPINEVKKVIEEIEK